MLALIKLIMSKTTPWVVAISVAIAGVLLTYSVYWRSEANNFKHQAEQEKALRLSEQTARKQEREEAVRVIATLEQRNKDAEKLEAINAELSQSLNRLRKSVAVSGAGRATAKKPCSCEPYRTRLAESKRLLIEGAELLQEGASLAGRTAADKDALAKIVH